ncbi:MAG: methionyl-tRNA formyltransferase [Pirellulaceae bacterium]
MGAALLLSRAMRLLMMGTGPFAAPTFETLLDGPHEVLGLVTRPVPPAVGRRKVPENPMRDVAVARGVELFEPDSINATESIERLAAWNADLLVVCDYGQILSREALGTSRLGGINLHGSLLPRHRGAAPVHWAIWEGDAETGVSVIHMTPRLDGGPILTTRRMPIGPDDTTASLEPRLAELGVGAVSEAIAMLESWDGVSSIGEPQDAARVTKAPRLNKQVGQVDWSQPAARIERQVRALQPWPGTYTNWNRDGEALRLILDRVHVVRELATESRPGESKPGEVVVSDGQQLVIATGEGCLRIERIQPAGKRVMEVAEFLRGKSVPVGTCFE